MADVRKYAAAVEGALEGLTEGLERYHVREEAKEAIHEAGEVTRAASQELRTQAQSPEMQQVRRGVQTAAHRTKETAQTASHSVRQSASGVRESVQEATEAVQERVHETTERVRHTAQVARAEAKVRGEAVAESGRRMKETPGHVKQELSAAVSAWFKGLMTAIAMWATLAVVGIAAFVVLTIALVVGLNALIGDPAGTFVVALLYLVLAGIAWAVARAARSSSSQESREHVENSKEEVRHAFRPLRDAVSTRRRTNI